MHFSTSALAALAIAFVQRVAGVAPTDSYRDADTAQSGYLPNHNMDPAVVDSSQFGQLWKVQFNSLEQVSHGLLTSSSLENSSGSAKERLHRRENHAHPHDHNGLPCSFLH